MSHKSDLKKSATPNCKILSVIEDDIMKTLFCLLTVFILSGCLPRAMQPPPTGWKAFHVQKHKNITPETIKKDMITCGFDNPNSSNIEDDDEQDTKYINATLCMESKGHRKYSLPKGVCYRYADKPACQTHQKKN